MDKESVKKISEMCVEMVVGDDFCFTVRDESNTEYTYSVRVKCIWELESILILVGNIGDGFNRVFLANDNMVNRTAIMMEDITKELEEEFSGYKFVEFETE